MEEAISAGNSSGEVLMTYYRRKLGLVNEKQLCFHAIVTQRHFFNSVHKDKSAFLSSASQDEIVETMNSNKHFKTLNERRYINLVLKFSNGKLPKSTTCCWSLRGNCSKYKMFQYFVAPDHRFAIDLSSENLKDHKNVGATFLSSLFNHVTSIPIWIDDEGKYFLKGPREMYNFAWGSNGGSTEKN